MPTTATTTLFLPLTDDGARVEFDCSGHATGTVQAALKEGAWGGAVLTVQRSNDGVDWNALEEPETFAAPGQTKAIDVYGFAMLGVVVSTPGSDAETPGVARVSYQGFAE